MNIKKILTVITIIILLVTLRNIVASITHLVKNESTVQDLRAELDNKKKEHSFLKQRLSFVKTNEFVESEAREKLGLVRENEQPVFVELPAAVQSHEEVAENKNWEKWRKIFRM